MAGVSPAQTKVFQALSCRAATVTLPATGATVNVKACAPTADLPALPAPVIGMRAIGTATALRKPGADAGMSIRERHDRRRTSEPVATERRVQERRVTPAATSLADAVPASADGLVPVTIAGDIDTTRALNDEVAAAASPQAASLLAAGGAATITVPNDGNTQAAVAKWIQDTRLSQPDAQSALNSINQIRLRRDSTAQPFTMAQVADALAVAALAMNGTQVAGPDLTVTIPNEATFNALVQDALAKAAREGTLGMPLNDAIDVIAALNVSAQRANGLTTPEQLAAAEDAAVARLGQERYVGPDGIVVTAESYRKKHRRGETSRRGLAVLEAAESYRAPESNLTAEITGFSGAAASGERAQATATQRRAVALATENQARVRRNQGREDEQGDRRQQVAAVAERRIDRERGEMADAVSADDGSPEAKNRAARIVSA